MYELTVDSKFAAAHRLKGYKGDCARIHGHTWGVSATVRASRLDELGMCIDFKEISGVLDDIVSRFDHQNLSDIEEFKRMNPTAENLGKLMFDLLSEKLNNDNVRVMTVTIAESDRYRVTYREDPD